MFYHSDIHWLYVYLVRWIWICLRQSISFCSSYIPFFLPKKILLHKQWAKQRYCGWAAEWHGGPSSEQPQLKNAHDHWSHSCHRIKWFEKPKRSYVLLFPRIGSGMITATDCMACCIACCNILPCCLIIINRLRPRPLPCAEEDLLQGDDAAPAWWTA